MTKSSDSGFFWPWPLDRQVSMSVEEVSLYFLGGDPRSSIKLFLNFELYDGIRLST